MTDLKARREEFRKRCGDIDSGIRNNHIWTGVFILLVGIVALVKVSNPDMPAWIFTWKTLLIALGVFIGIKHRFRGFAWFLFILVGGAFLFNDFYPDIALRRYIWPVALILLGAFLVLRPRSRYRWKSDFDETKTEGGTTIGGKILVGDSKYGGAFVSDDSEDFPDDYVNTTSIFGGAKRNVISKNFRGGDVVNVFGGTELDLTRADFNGTAVLELTTIFGGTKLVVPSNWTIKSEAVTIFGGLEDKRNTQTLTEVPDKNLVLRGTVIFGGIEIKSY